MSMCVLDCPPGQHISNGHCCPNGSEWNERLGRCVPICDPATNKVQDATGNCICKEGYNLDSTGNCIKCTAPKTEWNNETKVCECPAGRHGPNCIQCVAPKVWNNVTGVCECPRGLHGPDCIACADPKIWNEAKQACECPPDRPVDDGRGHCCPAGYKWDEDQRKCVLPDYTKKITINSPVQFGGLLKGDIAAKFKTEKVQKMGRNGPLIDPRTRQPVMEDKVYLDENGKKVVLYQWRGFAPFILGDISTVIDGSTSSVAFLIKKTNPIFAGQYVDQLGKVFRENAPHEDVNNYIYTLKKGQNVINAQKQTWKITPISVTTLGCPRLLAEAAQLAQIPSKEGLEEDDPLIQINFNYTESLAIRDAMGNPKVMVAPPVIIAAKSIRSYINHSNQVIIIPPGTSVEMIANYVRAALLPGHSTPPSSPRAGAEQGGGAIIRINDHIDDVPYTFALQKLWEDKLKHYKSIEPEYQMMLPKPDPSPMEELQEPFHRYMDEFGDQDILEEARATIGMMSPEDAENLFHDDDHKINSLYEKAMPDVDDRLIPIFIRADILRLLTK